MADVKYKEEEVKLTPEQASAFSVAEEPPYLIVSGQCPCCGHRTESEHRTFSYGFYGAETMDPETEKQAMKAALDAGLKLVAKEEDLNVLCECNHSHDGRPATEPEGCGRFWSLYVVLER
jgi:hypothetical protein